MYRLQLHHRLFVQSLTCPSSHPALQTEIAKRLNTLINQLLPFLQADHQQQVLNAVERAKQVTMQELNLIIGVSFTALHFSCSRFYTSSSSSITRS